jgi:hypothetical protein
MIDVVKIPIPKEQLAKLSPEERSVFLTLGYASNQVCVLWKMIIFSTNHTPTEVVEQRVTAAQTQILVRLCIGVLQETWQFVSKRFLSSKLGREYEPLLGPTGRSALEGLKKRFGGSNMLAKIRNNYAFHHPDEIDMEAAFAAASTSAHGEPEDWNWYLTTNLLNTFFFVSDFVMAHGMMNAAGETDLLEAHRKILGELGPVASELSEFTGAFIEAILRKHFGTEMTGTICAKIANAPKDNEVFLPFYIETPPISGTIP